MPVSDLVFFQYLSLPCSAGNVLPQSIIMSLLTGGVYLELEKLYNSSLFWIEIDEDLKSRGICGPGESQKVKIC